jgi:hypothetical protein
VEDCQYGYITKLAKIDIGEVSPQEKLMRTMTQEEYKIESIKTIFDHFFLHHVVFNNVVLIWMLFSHEIIIHA